LLGCIKTYKPIQTDFIRASVFENGLKTAENENIVSKKK
jgi:hypothetical protein